MRRHSVTPPQTPASGWRTAAARRSTSWRKSHRVAWISPVATGVATAAATRACPSTSSGIRGSSNPAGTPRLPRAHRPDRARRVAPGVVGVEEQLDAGPDRLAGGRNSHRVLCRRHAADLDLDGVEAQVHVAPYLCGEIVGGLALGVVAAAGVGRRHLRAVAAEVAVQGQVGLAGHRVPQRLVDGADGPHHRAPPAPGAGPRGTSPPRSTRRRGGRAPPPGRGAARAPPGWRADRPACRSSRSRCPRLRCPSARGPGYSGVRPRPGWRTRCRAPAARRTWWLRPR